MEHELLHKKTICFVYLWFVFVVLLSINNDKMINTYSTLNKISLNNSVLILRFSRDSEAHKSFIYDIHFRHSDNLIYGYTFVLREKYFGTVLNIEPKVLLLLVQFQILTVYIE